MEPIHSQSAPAAIGPYSQAIRTGNLVFTSGQIGLDPESGAMVSADVGDQTRQVLDNLEAVLAAAGSSLGHAVKVCIYLADMDDFATVNDIYGARMGDPPPARATVEVSRLPKDARVEMDVVAEVAGA